MRADEFRDEVTERPYNPCGGVAGLLQGLVGKRFAFQAKKLTLGNYGHMGSRLKISLEKWGLWPMRLKPSGKLVRNIGSHLQLLKAEWDEFYSAILEMVLLTTRSWDRGRGKNG
jgi:hypothetical protein